MVAIAQLLLAPYALGKPDSFATLSPNDLNPLTASNNDVPSPDGKSAVASSSRDLTIRWIWRITAALCWVWAIARIPALRDPLHFVYIFNVRDIGALVIGALVLYLFLKRSLASGCAAALLGFPLYVLLYPLFAPYLVLRVVFSATAGGIRRSQEILASLFPYALTVAAFSLLIWLPGELTSLVALALCSLSLVYIFLSLVTWLFRPLSWAAMAFDRFLKWRRSRMEKHLLPSDEELRSGSPEAKNRLKEAVRELLTTHKLLCEFPGLQQRQQDVLLTLGFSRKFFVSVVHASFLFGLIHFSLASALDPPGARYAGLPVGELQNTWFAYVFFATMNLIGGEPGGHPVTVSAQLAVLGNSLYGIGLFVLLVTTFSMLTREHAGERVKHLVDRVYEMVRTSEHQLLRVAVLASATGSLSDEIVSELEAVKVLKYASEEQRFAFTGAILLHKSMHAYQTVNDFETLAFVHRARATLGTAELSELYRRSRADHSDGVPPEHVVFHLREIVKGTPQDLFHDISNTDGAAYG